MYAFKIGAQYRFGYTTKGQRQNREVIVVSVSTEKVFCWDYNKTGFRSFLFSKMDNLETCSIEETDKNRPPASVCIGKPSDDFIPDE
jgi:hypothetical protein